MFFINITKRRKQIHLQNEPLTFNLIGCTSYLDHVVHLAHLGPQCGLHNTYEVLTTVLEEKKWPTCAPPASIQSTFFRPSVYFRFTSTSNSLKQTSQSLCMQSSKWSGLSLGQNIFPLIELHSCLQIPTPKCVPIVVSLLCASKERSQVTGWTKKCVGFISPEHLVWLIL